MNYDSTGIISNFLLEQAISDQWRREGGMSLGRHRAGNGIWRGEIWNYEIWPLLANCVCIADSDVSHSLAHP